MKIYCKYCKQFYEFDYQEKSYLKISCKKCNKTIINFRISSVKELLELENIEYSNLNEYETLFEKYECKI